MELPLILIMMVALCFASVSGHAAKSDAEAYWKAKLGNTPMTKAMINGLKGLKEDTLDANPATISQLISAFKNKFGAQATNIDKFDVEIVTRDEKYGKRYEEATFAPELLNSGLDLFFFEKYLTHPGQKLNLHFINVYESIFLPLQLANSIPFTQNKLPEILNLLSVDPDSIQGKIIQDTVANCEDAPIEGEENKHCPTSLEDLVDYVVSSIGNKVRVLSTTIDKEITTEYTVEKAQKVSNEGNLVCHKTRYPYAVFYCHNIKSTDAYVVSLVDANGKKSKGVAVCHRDTSSWNPSHLAFQLLKVEPGTATICHFLDADDMIWTPEWNIMPLATQSQEE